MAQNFFTTASVVSTSSPIQVKIGFNPGRVEVINLNATASPTSAHVFKALWQYGMTSGTAILTKYTSAPADETIYQSSNGITLLNVGGQGSGQYGAIASGFTNANTGVITVDSTTAAAITAGCVIQVEGLADDQSGATLNGVYTVLSVTATTITTDTNTTSYGVYQSGGFVTLVTNANPTSPNPPYNIYSNVATWYNQAIQGIQIGTACLTNASASDTLLIAAWDINSGGL